MAEESPRTDHHNSATATDQMAMIADLAAQMHAHETGEGIVGAVRYQSLAEKLGSALSGMPADDEMCAVFIAYPCAIEIFENTHYEQAGLCLREPDEADESEQLAIELIETIRSRA